MAYCINKIYGKMPDGEEVQAVELTNNNGMQINVISFGATLTAIKVPLVNNGKLDVVLGFDTLEAYIDSFQLPSAPYFGAIVGRYAGRINKGEFVLNQKKWELNRNNNGHALHGGPESFSAKNWSIVSVSDNENPSVTLGYISKNNEENYPGELSVFVTYTLTETNEVQIAYSATTTEDTVVNLTHHSYFNLDGHQNAVDEQELFVNSTQILEKTDQNIPTGRVLNLAGNVFDFSSQKKCPQTIDDTFVLKNNQELVASLFSPKNKLQLSVYTNQPGVHIYVGGNCFDKIPGKELAKYHPLSGICFETQNFPDAPNHAHFPSAVLKKGENYSHKTIYKFQSL